MRARRHRSTPALCGATLARAHARWGDRDRDRGVPRQQDAFDRAIADFADAYADQNERDYAAFVAAIASGRVPSQAGV